MVIHKLKKMRVEFIGVNWHSKFNEQNVGQEQRPIKMYILIEYKHIDN